MLFHNLMVVVLGTIYTLISEWFGMVFVKLYIYSLF